MFSKAAACAYVPSVKWEGPVALWPCQSSLLFARATNLWCEVAWFSFVFPSSHRCWTSFYEFNDDSPSLVFFLLWPVSVSFLKIPHHRVLCVPGWPQNHHVAEAGLDLTIFLPPLPKCYACVTTPSLGCSLYSLHLCPLSHLFVTNTAFIPWDSLRFLDISSPKHCNVYRMHKAVYFYIGIPDFSICSFVPISLGNEMYQFR